ncbi:hypothetical protein P153DRAFT_388090 [Dothidotthia symphoricarpi CBS 119687]|uniref:Uncharacterized protein n=1 Tax=Dothidotthia symphoricarpi CBS 119687 TaxID=1392245 RepID=A0A6A6A7K1_9PLEO|nr:uncharacterized protein P153DRAFT_388090 [Dothidotthia symphoricarpi CBS 119687]KAF2126768.1 hypothetical protein P153DRAFT_388090 [Dothidotthia symphoricarpi CBS 119687]
MTPPYIRFNTVYSKESDIEKADEFLRLYLPYSSVYGNDKRHAYDILAFLSTKTNAPMVNYIDFITKKCGHLQNEILRVCFFSSSQPYGHT